MFKSLGWVVQTSVGVVMVAVGAVSLVVASIQSAIDEYMDD
jgi:hypothetical protein